MRTVYKTTDATATGDTVKTLMGNITVPADANRLVLICGYASGAATMTSGEPITGIMTIESDEGGFPTQVIPLDVVDVLTSGAAAYPLSKWNCSIGVEGMRNGTIRCYITMDVAQTGGLKGRVTLMFECA